VPGVVILGAQWGDEGKGRIVDALAGAAHLVVRYAGGGNAGHTVIADGITYRLHLVPCGALHPGVDSVVADGCVVDPWAFLDEVETLRRDLQHDPVIKVSSRAHLVLPHHRVIDPVSSIGTTGRGIGPAYADMANRIGLRAGELAQPEVVRSRLEALFSRYHDELTQGGWPDAVTAEAALGEVAGRFLPYVTDTVSVVRDALAADRRVLFEGAQGAMLDVVYGTYPYVTSSHTGVGGVLVGTGVSHKAIRRVYGVSKAYCTRVGQGPFPTELADETGEYLRREGREFGATTGRPRRTGWMDAVALREAVRVNGVDGLVLTKVDVLASLPEVAIGVEYVPGGVRYERLPGWGPIGEARTRAALPKALQSFIARVEELAECPVVMVSAGPQREGAIGTIDWG
jgi:adenylosuccinate synthase